MLHAAAASDEPVDCAIGQVVGFSLPAGGSGQGSGTPEVGTAVCRHINRPAVSEKRSLTSNGNLRNLPVPSLPKAVRAALSMSGPHHLHHRSDLRTGVTYCPEPITDLLPPKERKK